MAEARESALTPSEVVVRRNHDTEYKTLEPVIPGVAFRVEKDDSLKMPRRAMRGLVAQARKYIRQKDRIAQLTKLHTGPGGKIKDMAAEYGVRGVELQDDGTSLTTYPKYSVAWDEEKLLAALGPDNSPLVVHSEVNIQLAIPFGHTVKKGGKERILDPELVQKAFYAGMLAVTGMDAERVAAITTVTQTTVVNESMLGQLVEDDKVHLSDDTGQVTETYAINTGLLKPRPAAQS